MTDTTPSPEVTPKTTEPTPSSGNPLLSLLGRNLLWALGSLAGAVAGAVVASIVFFLGALAVGAVGQYVLQMPDAYEFGARAGGFAPAAGVLLGGVFGGYLPLMAFKEGEQRMHEKILATALVIAILVIAWRLNSDTVFAAGWMGLAVIVVGVGILAVALSLFSKKS